MDFHTTMEPARLKGLHRLSQLHGGVADAQQRVHRREDGTHGTCRDEKRRHVATTPRRRDDLLRVLYFGGDLWLWRIRFCFFSFFGEFWGFWILESFYIAILNSYVK